MKYNKIKRLLALVLVTSMILSNASVIAFAVEEEEYPTYCGLEEHTHEESCYDPEGTVLCQLAEHIHIDECYIDPNSISITETEEIDTAATEVTEETAATVEIEDTEKTATTETKETETIETEATEETAATVEPESTEATEVTEETEGTEETESAESTGEISEGTLFEELMAIQDLDLLYETVFTLASEDFSALCTLTNEELALLTAHAQAQYNAIPQPDDMDAESLDMLLEMFEMLESCPDCGEIAGEHIEDCPVVQKQVLATEISTDQNGGTISVDTQWILQKDITLNNALTITSGATMTIDLNGYVLYVASDNRLALIEGQGKLHIKDSNQEKVHYGIVNDDVWTYSDTAPTDYNIEIKGGIITGKGNTSNWGGAICVSPYCELTIDGGTISNFTALRGGTIRNSGIFRMNGGTISNNTATAEGGGIHSNGTVNMTGGTVSNNTAPIGGGVCNNGTFNMSGGVISGNEATSSGSGQSAGGGGVYTNGTFNMTGGTIGGSSTESANIAYNGGGVTVADGQFTLNGGIITGNTATADGGGIYEYNSSNVKVSIVSGSISKNVGAWGGGIHAASGTLNISGGMISENTGNTNGGGVCFKNTIVTMTDGTISANQTPGKGGGIFVETGELTLSGGIISDNTANNGGGICNAGTATMNNGTVSGNTANNGGGGIYNSGTATMNNGTVSGNTANNGGGVYNAGTATMGGSATASSTISDNHSNGHGGGVYNAGTFTMNYGTISVNQAGSENGTDSADGRPVNTSWWGGGVYTAGGGTSFTMENGIISNNIAASGGGVGVWNGSVFTMNGGIIGGEKEGDGNKAYGTGGPGNGGAAYVNGSTFNFNGGIIQYNWARRYGGAINLNEGGKLVFGGTTECIIQYNSANNGGGVSQEQGECAISIPNNNIKIRYNTARDDNRASAGYLQAEGYGGGVFIEMGTLDIQGGIIANNSAVAGGGIALRIQRVDGDITVNMTGGSVSENRATETGGGIDIYAKSHTGDGSNDAVVNLKGGTFHNNQSGFDVNGNAVGTGDGTGGGIDIWTAESKATAVMKIGEGATDESAPSLVGNKAAANGGAIRMRSGYVYLYNGIISGNTAGKYGGGITVNGGNFEMSGGTIGGDIAESANTAGIGGGGIALRVHEFAYDITVTMTGGTIAGNKAVDTGGGMDIFADCAQDGDKNEIEVLLQGGTFDNNETTAGTGGGIDIWVNETNSTANLYLGKDLADANATGPTFTRNTAATNGGAIRMRSGNVYLYSGTISGNSAGQYGGGITVNGGNFEMHGGTIGGDAEESANTAGSGGGGIALRVQEFASDITVTMTGGTIAGNKAVDTGGGMDIFADYAQDGNTNNIEVLLEGGTFEGNETTAGTGGGIDIWVNETNSTANLYLGKDLAGANATGPTFTRNTAATNGGAIRMRSGSVYLHKALITENQSVTNGGAISVNGGDLYMYDGTISDNTATDGHGGAVVLSNGVFTMYGGSVTNNTAKKTGGAIAVSNGTVIMAGGEISHNTSEGHGGGIYVTSYGAEERDVVVKIFSGYITNNQSLNGSGGAVAIQGGSNSHIIVQTGLNLWHDFATNSPDLTPIPHTQDGKDDTSSPPEFIHEYCPVIENNVSKVSGGGFFISGGTSTQLNIYCIAEADNSTIDDQDHNGVELSDFMMVEGGKVTISSAKTNEDGAIDENTWGYGSSSVLSSVHVYAGELYLYGSMDNPAFTDVLTVDRRNPTDRFEDYRQSDSKFKLTYNENFTDANDNPDSTIKAYDIKKGTEVVTIAELIFKHPGYTILSWNTEPDGSGKDYAVGDEYIFLTEDDTDIEENQYPKEAHQEYQYGHLDLYAIWEANMFLVEFHSSVPEGEAYSGSMDGEYKFTYDDPKNKLPKNQFVRPGYLFSGWTYTDDNGNSQSLQDEHSPLPNLTNVKGGTVHLYAIWTECGTDEHPHQMTYSATGNVLEAACTQCQKRATVTILAENAVYDGNKHGYTVVYSDQEFLKPVINCTAKKIDSNDPPVNLLVDAGVYTVTATVDGSSIQATKSYTIEKADQRAPTPPTYTPPQGEGIVTINQISDVLSPDSKEQVQYAVKYLDSNDEWVTSAWTQSAYTTDQTVAITVDQNLTNYYVLTQYPGNDNYKPSDIVEAGESFFFHGNITVTIVPTPGIQHTATGKDGGLELELVIQDGYYLNDGFYHVAVTSGGKEYIVINDDNAETEGVYQNTTGKFTINADDSNSPDNTVSIVLTVGHATKATTIVSKVAEGQVFGTVSGSEATISRDSAYTAYFEVSDYNSDVYSTPYLTFNSVVPAGTKLILLDKINNSYWSYTVGDSGTTDVALADFVRMGGSDTFSPAGKNWKIQVIVDFSQVAEDKLLNMDELTTRLCADKKAGALDNAPDLADTADNAGVTVTLADTGFSLTATGGLGLTQGLSYSFGSDMSASKWDHRELALLLRPIGSIPGDAMMIAEQSDGKRVRYRPVQIPKGDGTDTAFLIPLDGFGSSVSMTLDSFTITPGNYSMSVQLVAANSIAEDAPVNGTVVASIDKITFYASKTPLSLKVTEENSRHVFNRGNTMKLNVQIAYPLPAGYELVVELEEKRGENTEYDFFGVYYSSDLVLDSDSYTLTKILALSPGNYRLHFYIETTNGYCAVETYYYFIVQ